MNNAFCRCALLLFTAMALLGCAHGAGTPAPSPTPTDTGEAYPAYTSVTLSVRRDAKTVYTRETTDAAELRMAEEIVFDYLVKSAAWEGVEVSELEECISLTLKRANGERETYYQFDAEGTHVLQAGETGWYTVMSGDAYETLLRLCALPIEAGA